MHDRVERIESVKAGSLSGIAAGLCYSFTLAVDRSIVTSNSLGSIDWSLNIIFALQIAIAVTGGFLFGVTYRYIIRNDRNDHLKSGAVLAFGLVRGLAQVDVQGLDLNLLWLNGVVVAESILLFAIARYTLDYALSIRWIAPFKSSL